MNMMDERGADNPPPLIDMVGGVGFHAAFKLKVDLCEGGVNGVVVFKWIM